MTVALPLMFPAMWSPKKVTMWRDVTCRQAFRNLLFKVERYHLGYKQQAQTVAVLPSWWKVSFKCSVEHGWSASWIAGIVKIFEKPQEFVLLQGSLNRIKWYMMIPVNPILNSHSTYEHINTYQYQFQDHCITNPSKCNSQNSGQPGNHSAEAQ